MMVCLHGRIAPLLTPLFILPLVIATGCGGGTSDESSESAPSAVGAVAAYDAVIHNGTKVATQDVPTAHQSASTHLVGWIPRVTPGGSAKQLLAVGRWSDIRDADGSQPFTHAQVISDSGAAVRKLVVKLTLDGGVDLDVKAVASEVDNTITVRFTNTSAYTHWFIGTILEPEKLVMELKLVPYNGGVIVDATTRVKLEQMEDRAPKLTASITAIFDWLKKNAR